jgi:two-component system chemotaxis response regulator CheB
MSHIRVLIVDDSAFTRKVLREVLSRDSTIEIVGVARDGLEALEKVAELRPDVTTLDLVMPELDGLGVLRELPKESPPRVIIVSVSQAQTDLAIEALQNGAVDLVTKPSALATDRLYKLSKELVAKVKAAAEAVPRLRAVSPRPLGSSMPARHADRAAAGVRLVVSGTSTGGPLAPDADICLTSGRSAGARGHCPSYPRGLYGAARGSSEPARAHEDYGSVRRHGVAVE